MSQEQGWGPLQQVSLGIAHPTTSATVCSPWCHPLRNSQHSCVIWRHHQRQRLSLESSHSGMIQSAVCGAWVMNTGGGDVWGA